MRFTAAVAVVLASLVVPLPVDDPDDSTRPITQADTILAIYREGHGLASTGKPRILMAAWGDGRIVWSEDRVRGGAPYYSGQVKREKLVSLLERMDNDGVFSDKTLARGHFGPEATVTTIIVKVGKKQLNMQSWHEQLFADANKVAATSTGIEPLYGRRRLDALRGQPPEYLYYRLVWSEIWRAATELIPADGKPLDGEPVRNAGVLFWRDVTSK